MRFSSCRCKNAVTSFRQRSSRLLLERRLLAAEIAESSTVGGCAAPATTVAATPTSSTTSTAVEATTSSTSATVTETTAAPATTVATTAEATTTACGVVGLTLGCVVKPDGATSDVDTLQSLVGRGGLLNRVELDVAEALRVASVAVSRETDALDAAVLGEDLGEGGLVGVKADVADEQRRRWWLRHIAVLLGTVVAALLRSSVGVLVLTTLAEVNTKTTAIDLGASLALESLGSVLHLGELNVAKALASARVAVGDDSDASELAILLKLAGEPVLIDVPAEVTNEQVGGWLLSLAIDHDLGALRGGRGLLLRLALLVGLLFDFGCRLLLLLVILLLIIVRRVIIILKVC